MHESKLDGLIADARLLAKAAKNRDFLLRALKHGGAYLLEKDEDFPVAPDEELVADKDAVTGATVWRHANPSPREPT